MPVSSLQKRAVTLAQQFATDARRPVVIEFAGVPKAGKTSTINQIHMFLKRCGFKVEVVIERASVCPIRDKRHSNFNAWTSCTTLANILEKTQDPPHIDDPQILILDRGLFDSVCWLSMMERLNRLRADERKRYEDFLLMDDWRTRINDVILMTASSKDAMEREVGYLPVEREGSIMNEEVLSQMRACTLQTADRLKDLFRIHHVDTSAKGYQNNPKGTAEAVAKYILDSVDEHLQEAILTLPRTDVANLFQKTNWIDNEQSAKLITRFENKGIFRGRKDAEKDLTHVQALPVVVVRNKTGDVLLLKRRETSTKKSLHQKMVLWAGGHVRREDSAAGQPVIHGALRELEEELRLRIEPGSLHLIGSYYDESDKGTAKHVAFIYEWQAPTDDVAIVLSSVEFYERRGTSLSGTFVSCEKLAEYVNTGELKEPWSLSIAKAIFDIDYKHLSLF